MFIGAGIPRGGSRLRLSLLHEVDVFASCVPRVDRPNHHARALTRCSIAKLAVASRTQCASAYADMSVALTAASDERQPVSRVDQLRNAFGVICILPPTREDIEVILELAQLVVDIDGGEGTDEIKLFFQVGKVLFELAEAPDAPIPTFASHEDDEERLFDLATQLRSTEVRELGFVVCRVLAEADLEIVAAEETFIQRLRSLLSISKERAEELDTILRSA